MLSAFATSWLCDLGQLKLSVPYLRLCPVEPRLLIVPTSEFYCEVAVVTLDQLHKSQNSAYQM